MEDDFLGDHPELRPYVLSDVQFTGTAIGHGAYGSVEEVAVCGAAKKVHDVLLGSPKITSQFAEELQLMSTLRHPNIVQFLGVCFFPGSRLPALVMERLLTSLHDLLDPKTGDAQPPPPHADAPRPLSFFTMGLKCRVLHNVANGLVYLHERSPPIIHRDLSAKNVLLTSELVGKIADLGVARIGPRMRDAATMTQAPGASVYMPPEAIAPADSNKQKSKYDASIDIFSLGIVTIFIIGQAFPCDPLAPTFPDEDGKLVARTELQRRSEYMLSVNTQLCASGQLCGDHPLIQLIQQCLQNVPAKRPSIREVLHLIELARGGIRDEESERNKVKLVRALQNQPRKQERVHQDPVTDVTELQQQLHLRSQQLGRKEAELTRAEETIRREQQQIHEMRETITREQQLVQAKDRELVQAQQQLRQQEQSSRREIGDLERQLRSSEGLVAEFQKTLRQRDSELETQESKPLPQLIVQCIDKMRAPHEMKRGSGTSDLQHAYFLPLNSHSVYRYEWSTEKWDELPPPCPYLNSALVIIDGALTAVGGQDGYRHINKLFTLRQGHWVEELPSMKTGRSMTAVVSTPDGEYVLVIAGAGGCSVELFQVSSRRWSEVTELPQPLPQPSATICGNHIHVIGDDRNGFSCSLQDLPSSDQLTTSQSRSRTISWSPLPPLPVTRSTVATLCGQLVIIGGKRGRSVNSIHQLVNGQWMEIGTMSSGRRRCLVVSQPPNKMMIVGGCRGLIAGTTGRVEECVVLQ